MCVTHHKYDGNFLKEKQRHNKFYRLKTRYQVSIYILKSSSIISTTHPRTLINQTIWTLLYSEIENTWMIVNYNWYIPNKTTSRGTLVFSLAIRPISTNMVLSSSTRAFSMSTRRLELRKTMSAWRANSCTHTHTVQHNITATMYTYYIVRD